MKRLLVLVLAVVLVAASLVGCDGTGNKVSGTLIVGSPAISGDFINGFGNSAYDAWVKTILHEYYGTYITTADGEIVLNETVVKDVQTETDDAGNKIYTFELHKDLKWSNGEAITAKDYVFYVLWAASPEWTEAGASSALGFGLLGYTDYLEDTTERFAGVKLVDDYKFSLIIDAAELPYFYETSYVATYPVYMEGWAPAGKIDSNDDGAMITSDNEDWTLAFDTKRISQTERFAPTVTSGPYNFVSFENNAVTLKANPEFKGDYNGNLPKLEYIIIRYINQTTDVDQCINGEVDAVTGVVEGPKIEKAKTAAETETIFYPRNGYGGMFYHCDFGPTAIPEVRHALAYLMDRQEIITHVLGGYGSVTNGEYGLAQWMYQDNKAAIDALPNFVLNPTTANELLDATDYKFEADGKTAFDPAKAGEGKNYFRHNSKGERLIIEHLGTEDNDVTDAIEMQLMANTPAAGVDWRVTRSDFAQLLDHYYEGHLKDADRKYHSFNLATNFTVDYDPYFEYHSDWAGVTYYDTSHISDPRFDELTVKMRQLDPEKKDEYSAAWLE